jgi:transcriptional regulator with XRE-family HTH domain
MSEEFGRRLRQLRGSTGLTQEAFAQLGGVKRFSQSLYEQGVRLPGLDYLEGLHASGIDVSCLVQHLVRIPVDTVSVEVAIRAIEAIERSYATGKANEAQITDRIERFKLLVSFADPGGSSNPRQAQGVRRA